MPAHLASQHPKAEVAAMEVAGETKLTIRLPIQVHRELKQLALDTNSSLQAVVYRAIIAYLEKHEK